MLRRFALLSPAQVSLSSIVAAELRCGAAKLGSARLTSAVEEWLVGFDVQAWPLDATH